MNYRKYLPDSVPVSEIGLGAWQLGANSGWQNMSEKDAIYMVHKALDLGVNFFDTAPNYGFGTSEVRLGKALKGKDRSRIVINTKFGHTDANTTNFEADNIRASVEGSLKRLQCDFVDSLIFHNPPTKYLDGSQNAHYEILEQLKAEGKIKSYGASLDTYDEMKLLMNTTNSKVIEAFFNILHQDTARAFKLALEKDVAIIVKIPLDSGWLTGKYNKNSTFNDVRSRWSKSDISTRAGLVEKLQNKLGTAQELSKSAIAFCLAYKEVSTVIPGNNSIEQLESNVSCSQIRFTAETIKTLENFYQDEVKQLRLPW